MIDYKVVTASNTTDLELEVKKLLNDGWDVAGSANIAYKAKGTYMNCESPRTLSQSLTKKL